MRTLRLMLALLSIAGLSAPASSGGLDPELKKLLSKAGDKDLVAVVAQLRDRVDIKSLDAFLKSSRAGRQQRNQTVITALQEKAAETQGPLMEYLDAQQRQANLVVYESFWIDNLVTFTAIPSVIREVAGREDVATVFLVPEIRFDAPVDEAPSVEQVNSSEPGLRAINAHKLWRLGITGQGRLVMNIDSGVDGNHPAVASRWRGLLPGVQPGHAWYGPGSFPVETGSTDHGTHVMGTITGRHAGNQDTIGVAPDAYWIAGTSNYPGAFQWAVNPDGNPATVDDVPDVINCSWFTSSGDQCTAGSTYWSLMDNVEAAGAAVIWSAGNCGPSGAQSSCATGMSPGAYKTITPPKNRIASDVNAFAVGALDGNNPSYPIAGFSSRGPSACDTTVIKPEVSAPGVSVRSILSNNGYGTKSGTSMAAPHVSGAVALLRQLYPDAEVDEIKRALLYSARDLGAPGEDNTFGMGIVDVFEAAGALSPYQIAGSVRSSVASQPLANARIEIIETAQQSSTDGTGTYRIGPLRDTVQIRFSAFAHVDTTIGVILTAGVPESLHVVVQSFPLAMLSGSVTDSLSGQGVVAELLFYLHGDPGSGPRYTTTSQSSGTYEISGITGTYDVVIVPPAPYEDTVSVGAVALPVGGASVNFRLLEAEVLVVADDNGASARPSLKSSLSRLGLRSRSHDMQSGNPPATVLPLFSDPPVVLWATGSDSTEVLTAVDRHILMGHLNNGGHVILTGNNIAEYSAVGDTLLEGFLGVRFSGNAASVFMRGFPGDIIGDGISSWIVTSPSRDVLEFAPASSGAPTKTLHYGTTASDSANIAGVRVLGPGGGWGAVFFSFGIEGLPAVRQDTLLRRSLRYLDGIVTSVRQVAGGDVPSVYTLEQNYPNPFNPVTHIRYALPEHSRVSLIIYNVVGQEVARLVQIEQAAGIYEVTWNGNAGTGLPVSSGIYFYRLEATGATGVFGESRKMIFLK